MKFCRMMVLLYLAALMLLLACGQASAQESLWVASAGAKLKSGNTASSETLAQVDLGTQLELLASEGKWYKVKTPEGVTGWIYRGKVSSEQPVVEERGNLFGGLSGSMIQANASDTSRSIRGLSPEVKAYAERRGTSVDCQDALDRVLAVQISEGELNRFLREGRIGEYAD